LLSAFFDTDDRLTGGAIGRHEYGRCLGKRDYCSDNRTKSAIPEPELKGRELRAIGFDDEEDRSRIVRPHAWRFSDADEDASRTHQLCRAIENLTAYHVEHHVNLADVLPSILLQIQEGVRPETEHRFPLRGAAGTHHPRSRLARQLNRN
jgi:hypothetical protein